MMLPPGAKWCMVLLCWTLLSIAHSVSSSTRCTIPSYLRQPTSWSSHIRQWGSKIDRNYTFTEYSFNLTTERQRYHYQCHEAFTNDTYLFVYSQSTVPMYKCFKFDKWSSNTIQMSESSPALNASASLCKSDRLFTDSWLLVWSNLEMGYIPCPQIGGWDMEVMDMEEMNPYCHYIDPVPKPRFESECVMGEGLMLNFGLPLCKGNISLSTVTTLFCLGHRTISGYTHVVAMENQFRKKLLLFRYAQKNDTMDIHVLEDIFIETSDIISWARRKALIKLKNTKYNNLCTDNHHNCLAPVTCDQTNVINCHRTCKNDTSCLANKKPCDFDLSTRGNWIEETSMGRRVLRINKNNLTFDNNQGYFECLNIYSSLSTSLKPLVKVSTNGCKPRFACLDASTDGSNILKYRLSLNKQWPFKDNMVKGDLCRRENFRDGSLTGSYFHNEFAKILFKEPVTGKNIRRSTVPCNLDSVISFRLNEKCTGMLRGCQSGRVLVMTWGAACDIPISRVFYRCLHTTHTNLERYIVTEVSDDPTQLHCWVRGSFIGSSKYLIQRHASDCANGHIRPITQLEYTSEYQSANADSCLDIRSPTIPSESTSTESVKRTQVTQLSQVGATTIRSSNASSENNDSTTEYLDVTQFTNDTSTEYLSSTSLPTTTSGDYSQSTTPETVTATSNTSQIQTPEIIIPQYNESETLYTNVTELTNGTFTNRMSTISVPITSNVDSYQETAQEPMVTTSNTLQVHTSFIKPQITSLTNNESISQHTTMTAFTNDTSRDNVSTTPLKITSQETTQEPIIVTKNTSHIQTSTINPQIIIPENNETTSPHTNMTQFTNDTSTYIVSTTSLPTTSSGEYSEGTRQGAVIHTTNASQVQASSITPQAIIPAKPTKSPPKAKDKTKHPSNSFDAMSASVFANSGSVLYAKSLTSSPFITTISIIFCTLRGIYS